LKLSQFLWTVAVLIVFLFFEYYYVFPKTKYGTSVNITASAGDIVTIMGATEVNVKASTVGYFRITANRETLEGHPEKIESNKFLAEGILPAEGWDIRNGGDIDITITHPTMLVVTKAFTFDAAFAISIMFLLIGLLIWLVGILRLS
jgi:hypothetical protein